MSQTTWVTLKLYKNDMDDSCLLDARLNQSKSYFKKDPEAFSDFPLILKSSWHLLNERTSTTLERAEKKMQRSSIVCH